MSFRRAAQRRLMKAVDRIFGPASHRRQLDAAGVGGRWPAGSSQGAPASTMHAGASTVARRTAYLVANGPHAAAIVNAIVTNVVADGTSLRPRTGGKALADAYLYRFWPTVDLEGSDFGHFLQRVVRCWVVAGEAFVLMQVDPDLGEVRAQLIHPEQVDRTLTLELGDGGRVVAGVEQDARGRIVAYHILPDAPDLATVRQWQAVRIDAADVCHLYDPQTPGQRRGVSLLAPILTRLVEIDRLEDAQLATANVQALFGVFLRTPGGEFGALGEGAADPKFPSLEPGSVGVLPPGFEAEAFQGSQMRGAGDFLKSMLRSAAIGAGVPYALATGDLSDTNYSSARLGLLEFRRRVASIQKNLLAPRIIDPLWTRWATVEQLAGRLPRGDVAGEWVFPGWAALDPEKEANADAAAIAAGVRSRFEVIAARGRDPQTVDEEIAADTFRPRAADEA